ncbi:MAG TPA: tetrahydrodipicolinate succinyltransferase [Acidimicrobiaceae bacterium]|uniref:DapH/DapD/GlmU-related protein n=1 Tax=Microbacterium maritypicum TaxID=33918 RepID=UPI000EDFBB11|nr:DapH/DapD/GlmU-related protein [Microbacterium liquefaciens]HCB37489.1 tetrahydrodipicolinate succinyltransferase [Acidimicrobiaceae bacterium]
MGITAVGHSYVDVATGTRLDVWYPSPAAGHAGTPVDAPAGDAAPARSCLAVELGVIAGETVTTAIADLDDPPVDLADAYLRLHLLSRREVAPHGANLDGIFGLLTNCAWTTAGPVLPERVDELRIAAAARGEAVGVASVDKFPRMVDYVIPSGVRIADADRVRLGAHLADGTTVMHEGFVNFNAGTLGPAMIEGRISAGVVVGADSDLGGSSSTMGTMSGGGTERVSIGEHCLLGANSGIGIALGDYCTVEAGLYVTAGSRVTMPDGSVVRGRDLSGRSGMLLIRNSETGAIEMRIAEPLRWGGINEELHRN